MIKRPPSRQRLDLRPVSVAVCLLLGTPAVFGLPQGAVPTFGQTAVKQTVPGTLAIQQSSQRAGIDWTTFSIAAGEKVVITQPNSKSMLLNRVVGDDPSSIYGQLQSNGSVWLINPRGIVFGAGSRVDVGGLVASTLAITGGDIDSGRIVLGRGATAGELRADGQITAPGGNVVLAGPQVRLGGNIDARRIGLVAASSVEVDVEGDGLIFFNVRNDDKLPTRLSLLGNVLADGGSVEARAAARSGFADTVLNLDGVVRARGIGQREGRIVIDGGGEGTVLVAGTVDASADGSGEHGGSIAVLGQRVGIGARSVIDASGAAGGGSIRIGGGFHGADATLHNAEMVTVLAGATLRADAVERGNGGSVVVWSDQGTRFGGRIEARGGATGGDGGMVEVSGKAHLAYDGQSVLTAPRGKLGTLLLDPQDISIITSGTPNLDGAAPTGDDLAGTRIDFGDFGSSVTSTVTATAVQGQLTGNANVVLQAERDITVNVGGAINGNGSSSLTLQAGRNISIGSPITVQGSLTVSAHDLGSTAPVAGGAVSTLAALSAGTTLTITNNAGGTGTHQIGASLTAGTTLSVTGDLNLTAPVQIAVGSASTIASNVSGGALTKAGAGTLTLSGTNSYTGTTVTDGALTLASSAAAGSGTIALGANRLNIDNGASVANAVTAAAGATIGNTAGAGTLAAGGTLAAAAGGTLNFVSSGTGTGLTVARVVADGSAATDVAIGGGSVTFSATNTYGGVTAINAGTLQVQNGNAIPDASVLTMAAATTLTLLNSEIIGSLESAATTAAVGLDTNTLTTGGNNGSTTFAGVISGGLGSTLTKAGNGTFTLGNTNTYVDTNVTGGALTVSGAAAAAGSGTIALGANRLNIDNDASVANAVTAAAGATIGNTAGAGTLAAGGTLAAAAGGTLNFVSSGTGTGLTVARVVADGSAATDVAIGGGSVTLTQDNSYAGDTLVSAGTLTISGAAADAGSGTIALGANRLNIDNDASVANAVTAAAGATIGNTAGAGTLAAGGTLAAAAGGTLNFVSSGTGTGLTVARVVADGSAATDVAIGGGSVSLTQDNSYTGGTLVNAGTLTISGAAADAGSGTIALGANRLNIDNDASVANAVTASTGATIGNTAGAGTLAAGGTLAAAAGGTLNFVSGGTGTGLTVARAIADGSAATDVAIGGGSVTLTQDNSYTGDTLVNAGTLTISGAAADAGGGTIALGANRLNIDNGASIANAVTAVAGATIGNTAGAGTLAAGGTLAASAGGTLNFVSSGTGTGLTVARAIADGSAATDVAIGGGSVTFSATNTYGGGTAINAGTLQVQNGNAIPDASALTMAAATTLTLLNSEIIGSLDSAATTAAVGLGTNTLTTGGNNGSTTFAGVISGGLGSTLTKAGNGTFTLGNTNTYVDTNVTGGALTVSGAAAAAGSGTIALGANRLNIDNGASVANAVTAAAGATIGNTAGAGTLAAGGTLAAAAGGTLNFVSSGTGTGLTVARAIADGSAATNVAIGGGSVTFSATNTYGGGTAINAGTLQVQNGNAIPDASALTMAAATTLTLLNSEIIGSLDSAATTAAVGLGTNTLTTGGNNGSTTFAGVISGGLGSTLTKAGNGTFTLGNTNTYVDTSVTGGALTVSGAAAAAGSGTIALGANRLNIDNDASVANAVTAAAGATIGNTAGAGTLAAGGTLAAAAGGTLNFVSSGTGTGLTVARVVADGSAATDVAIGGGSVILTQDNSYTGDTLVNAGTLTISGAAADAGSGTIALGANRLNIDNDASVANAVTAAAGATIGNTAGAGTLAAGGTLAAAAGGTLNFVSSGTGTGLTVARVVADGSAATDVAIGGGSVTFSQATTNTYSGATTVSAGTLKLGASDVIPNGVGKGDVTVATGATLDLNGNSETINGLFGAGTVDDRLDNSTSTLTLGSGNATSTFSGTLTDSGVNAVLSLVKTGTGTVTLSGSNSYSGTTTVLDGRLVIGSASGLPSGDLVVNGIIDLLGSDASVAALTGSGTVTNSAAGAVTFTVGNADASSIFPGTLTNSGGDLALTKVGTGILTLTGDNTYTGKTTIADGAISVASLNSVGATAGSNLGKPANATTATITLGGSGTTGRLIVTGSGETSDRAFDLAGNGGIVEDNGTGALTLTGSISTATATAGAKTLTLRGTSFDSSLDGSVGDGSGSIALTKDQAGTWTLRGANSYSGATTIDAGTLKLGIADVIPDGAGKGDVGIAAGATLDLAGNSETVNGLTGNGSIDTTLAAATPTLTVGNDDATSTFAGTLAGTQGTLALIKIGSGTLTLTGINTYGGRTTIADGTISVGSLNSVGAGSGSNLGQPANATTATITLGGSGTTGRLIVTGSGETSDRAFDLAGNGGIVEDNGTGALTLTGGVSTATAGARTLTLRGTSFDSSLDGIVGDGSGSIALTKDQAGTWTLRGANSYSGATTIDAGTLKLGIADVIPDGAGKGDVGIAAGATLDLAGNSETVNGLTGNGTVDTTLAAATPTLTVGNDNVSSTFAGTLTDSQGKLSLTKIGSGTLTLGTANDYSGKTTVADGTLSVATLNSVAGGTAASSLGAPTTVADGTIDIGSGATSATLLVTSAAAQTSDRAINLAGTTGGAVIDQSGSGALTIGGDVTATGAGAKTLTLQGSTAAGAELAGAIVDSAGGATALTKTGSGTWTLSGASTYGGRTTISDGTLSVGSLNTANGSSFSSNLGRPGAATSTIDLGGAGTTGRLVYTGGGETSDRAFNLAGSGGTGGVIQNDGGGLTLTGAVGSDTAGAKTLTLQGNSTTSVLDGVVSDGSGGGSVALRVDSQGGIWTLGGANTYSGDTSVDSGTLRIGASDVIPDGSGKGDVVLAAGATLDLNGFAETVNGLSGTGNVDVVPFAAASTLTVGNEDASSTFTGRLTDSNGTLSLVKIGTGTLTLGSANDYSGRTSIGNGTLSVATLNSVVGGSATSSLGAPATVADGTIDIGSGTNAATLLVTGGAQTSDRMINLAGTTGGATIDRAGSGLLDITGNVTASGAGSKTLTLQGSSASSGQLSGVIADSSGGATALTKTGTGTWILAGANTYGGATTVGAGILQLGASNVIPDGLDKGDVSVASGAVLDLHGNADTINGLFGTGTVDTTLAAATATLAVGGNDATSTFTGTLTDSQGTLALTKTGSGTLTLGSANDYSGKTSIENGTLSVATLNSVAGGTASSSLGAPTTVADGTIDIGSGTTSGTLLVTGGAQTTDRVVNLAGTTGGATIDQSGTGALVFGSDLTASGAGAKTLTLQGSTAGSGQLSGAVVDSAGGATALAKTGTDTWTLSGASTYSGMTGIADGTLSVGSLNTASGSSASSNLGKPTPGTSTIDLGAGATTGRLLYTGSGESSDRAFNLAGTTGGGVIDDIGSGALILGGNVSSTTAGAKTLTLQGTSLASALAGSVSDGSGSIALTKAQGGTWTLSGTNTYSGDTTISAGILKLGQPDVIPDGSGKGDVTVDTGATLDLNGNSDVINGLSGAGTVDTTLPAATPTFTVGNNDATSTFAGTLTDTQGTLSLVKIGSGTLTLTGSNSYGGTTTILGGQLVFASAPPQGGDIVVGGVLDLLGHDASFGSISGDGIVTNSAAPVVTLTVGSANTSTTYDGILTNSGGDLALTKIGTGTLTLTGDNSYTGKTTIADGALSVATLNSIGAAAGSNLGRPANATTATIDLGGADTAGRLIVTGSGETSDRAFNLAGSGATGAVIEDNSSGALTLGGNVGSSTAGAKTLTLQGTSPASVLNGAIGDGAGSIALAKEQAGSWTLGGANSYSGGTRIDGGVLSVAADAGLGNVAGGVVIAGGTLRATDTFASGRGIALDTSGAFDVADGKTLTLNGSVVDNGAATGALRLAGTGLGTLALAGSNSYSGTTTVDGGLLDLRGGAAIADSAGRVTVNGPGALRVSDAETVRSIAGSGSLTLNATLTTGDATADAVYGGTIDGSSGLTKIGSGDFTLTNNGNQYAGPTHIAVGRLIVSDDGQLGAVPGAATAGNVVIDGGATLRVTGDTTLAANRGLAIDGSATIEVADTKTATLAGSIAGAGSLTKSNGTGTLVLAGTGAYTGTTTVADGTLELRNDGGNAIADGAGRVSVASGTTLLVSRPETVSSIAGSGTLTLNATLTTGDATTDAVYVGVVDGSSGLTKAGSGDFELQNAANQYAGPTHVAAGRLIVATDAQLGAVPLAPTAGNIAIDGGAALRVTGNTTLAANRGVALTGNATIEVADTRSVTIDGIVAGSGSLTKSNGNGALVLTGSNTYAGTTTVGTGTLELRNGNAIADGAGRVTVSAPAALVVTAAETVSSIAGSGVLTLNATLTTGDATADAVYLGAIGGSAGLVKQGSGIFTLQGNNSYGGITSVSGGTLVAASPSALGDTAAGTAVQDGATLRIAGIDIGTEALILGGSGPAGGDGGALSGSGSAHGGITLAAGTTVATAGSLALTGAIDGPGALTKADTGLLVLSGIATYGGTTTAPTTTVAGGMLQATTETALPDGGSVDVRAGAALDLTSNQTIGALLGSGSVTIAAHTLTTGGNGAATTFQGTIDGLGGRLVKQGGGIFTLTGANGYSGGTGIDGGTLAVAGAQARAGTGSPIVIGAQRLDIDDGAGVVNAVTIAGGTLGNTSGAGTLAGPLTLLQSSSFTSSGTSLTVSGNIGQGANAAGITASGGTILLSGTNGYTGTTTVATGVLALSGGQAIADRGAVVLAPATQLQVLTGETIGSLAGAGGVSIAGTTLRTGGNGSGTTFDGAITGAGGRLVKQGSGTFTLTASSTYDAGTLIEGGTLVVSGTTAAAGTGLIEVKANRLNINDGAVVSNDVEVGDPDVTNPADRIGTIGNTSGTGALIPGPTPDAGLTLLAPVNLGSIDAPVNVLTISAPITERPAGAGFGIQAYGGQIVLSGRNSYTGGTVLRTGSLQLSGGNTIDDNATVELAAGQTLTLDGNETIGSLAGSGTVALVGATALTTGGNNQDTTFAGVIAGVPQGGASLVKAGSGTFTLTGASTYDGGTTVAAGTLAISGPAAVAGSGPIFVGGQRLDIDDGAIVRNTVTVGNGTIGNTSAGGTLAGSLRLLTTSNLLSEPGGTGLEITGTIDSGGAAVGVDVLGGRVRLAPAAAAGNTYLGLTHVGAGTLELQTGGAIADAAPVQVDAGATLSLLTRETIGSLGGAGSVSLGTSTLASGGNGADTTFSGVIAGAGGLVKQGGGVFSLTSRNTYAGGTDIQGGTVAISAAAVADAAAGSGPIAVNGNRLDVDDGAVVANAVSIAGGTIGNRSGSGALAGPLTLLATSTLRSDGTSLTVAGAIGDQSAGAGIVAGGGRVVLSGGNRYSGDTAVDAGTLVLQGGAAIPDASGLTVAADAAVDIQASETIGSLAGNGRVTLGTNTLTTGGNDRATTFAGVIASGNLVKQGTGNFTLTGDNLYAGTTTVEAGTLSVAGHLASPSLLVSGGTLALLASEALPDSATLTVGAGATASLGGSETIDTFNLSGLLAGPGTLTAATYALDGGTTAAGADLGHGTLTARGASTLNGNTSADTLTVDAGSLTLASGGGTLTAAPALTVAGGSALVLRGNETASTFGLAGLLSGSGTLTAATTTLSSGSTADGTNLGAGALASTGSSSLAGTAASDSVSVADGTLTLRASGGTFSAAPAVTVGPAAGGAPATLAVRGNETFGTLSGFGTVGIDAAVLATGNGGDSTFAGVVTGVGALTKQGTSTFTLTGANTYSGETRIDTGGVLAIGNGTSGGFATSNIVVDGLLRFDRSGPAVVTLAQQVSGSGGIEQAGSGTLALQGSNKSYTGATTISGGSLTTSGNGNLPTASAVGVGAGTQLVLGGSETVASIASVDAPGTQVTLGGNLTTSSGAIDLRSPVVVAGGIAVALTTPAAQIIRADNAGNVWGSSVALDAGGAVTLSSGRTAAGSSAPYRDLALGTVDARSGGDIDAARITLGGDVTVAGGTLTVNAHAPQTVTAVVSPEVDDPTLLNKLTPIGRQIAFADDVVTQTNGTRITVAPGGLLSVRAPGAPGDPLQNGGSINLRSFVPGDVAELPINDFTGGLEVISGAPVSPWRGNPQTFAFSPTLYSVQNRARISGTTINAVGNGVEADVVSIKADTLTTDGNSVIAARLPFDNLNTGAANSVPGLTLELTPTSFTIPGPFGSSANELRVNIGSLDWGNRSDFVIQGGYMTVLPRGGAQGSTAVVLRGPAVQGSYGFFFDGAGQQAEIPVTYDGVLPVTPQVAGTIGATVSVSETARKERFEEAVRTENVAVRLRAGVIAEVGAGRPATVGTEGARPPESCPPAVGSLACEGGPAAGATQSLASTALVAAVAPDALSPAADFGNIDLDQATPAAVAALLDARSRYKKSVLDGALKRLESDPTLADAPPCTSVAQAGAGGCLVTDELVRQQQAAVPVVATPGPPLKAPITAAPAPAAAAAAQTFEAEAPLLKIRTVRQAALPQIERKLAVLIGEDRYADARIPSLQNSGRDVDAVATLLRDKLGYETLVLRDASRATILGTLNKLALQARPADSVLVYYAGHGEMVGKTGSGYWIPVNGSAEQPQTWISNADIDKLIARVQASQVVLVSDSCFSGSLIADPNALRASNQPIDVLKLLSARAAVVMSSGGNEPVADGAEGGHSPFASSLMKSLQSVDGWRAGSNVFATVRQDVARRLPQRPQYGTSKLGGHTLGADYLFEARQMEASAP